MTPRSVQGLVLLAFLLPGCGSRSQPLDPPQDLRVIGDQQSPSADQQSLPAVDGIDLLLVGSNDGHSAIALGGVLARRVVDQLLATTSLASRDVRLALVINQTDTYSWTPPAANPGKLVQTPRGTIFYGDQLDDWQEHTWADSSERGLHTYFEAAKLALDGRNAGFPRPNALLVLLLVATTEDCSLAKPELMWDASLWPSSFQSPYTRCYQPLPGMLRDPADYVDVLLAAHPQRIFVVATASREKPELKQDKAGMSYVRDFFVCSTPYHPSTRVAAFTDVINARQHARIGAGLVQYTNGSKLCIASHATAAEFATQIRTFAGL